MYSKTMTRGKERRREGEGKSAKFALATDRFLTPSIFHVVRAVQVLGAWLGFPVGEPSVVHPQPPTCPHTRTRTRARACTRIHTRAHVHTHTGAHSLKDDCEHIAIRGFNFCNLHDSSTCLTLTAPNSYRKHDPSHSCEQNLATFMRSS